MLDCLTTAGTGEHGMGLPSWPCLRITKPDTGREKTMRKWIIPAMAALFTLGIAAPSDAQRDRVVRRRDRVVYSSDGRPYPFDYDWRRGNYRTNGAKDGYFIDSRG